MDLMIDLETLGKSPRAVFPRIGWARFDPDEKPGTIESSGVIRVDIDDCLRCGLVVDGSTIRWWLAQEEKARAEMREVGLPLLSALMDLTTIFSRNDRLLQKTKRVWSRGPDFDHAILRNAFTAVGFGEPWSYNAGRDMRTLEELFPPGKWPEDNDHTAEGDARRQAVVVQVCFEKKRNLEKLAAIGRDEVGG
jgi:hypothetical protein